jgi:hypothetical protein
MKEKFPLQTFIPYESHANMAFRRKMACHYFFFLKLSPIISTGLQNKDLHIFD